MIKKFNTPKFIILFTVFVDILGFGIVIPVLPFYIKSFGASDFTITALFSVFSLFSFISAPFLGALSDRIGRRPVLILSIASTALGWLIFASAKSLPLMFLARIIDGAAAGNIPIAQSYLSDMSKDHKDRTANLGLIGAMFGIGLTIGPMIGGFLGSISHTLPFWVVGAMAAINALMALFRLPETHHNRDTSQKIELNPLAPIGRALKDKQLLPGYTSWFLFGLAVASQQAVFALFLNRAFGFGEFISGLFLTGIGITLSLNQAFLMRKFWIKRFKEPQLELYMLLLLAVGFSLMSFELLTIFVIGVAFFTLSHSVLRVVMTSQIAGASGQKQGEAMGIMTSVMSLSMIIGPSLAGWLFTRDFRFPFLFSTAIVLLTIGLIVYNRKKLSGIKPDEEAPANFAI